MLKKIVLIGLLLGFYSADIPAEIYNYKRHLIKPVDSDSVSLKLNVNPEKNTSENGQANKGQPQNPEEKEKAPKSGLERQFHKPFQIRHIITINFAPEPDNPHRGVVFSPLEAGGYVISSMDGKVVAIDYMDGYNNYIVIEHPNQFYTVYANLDEINVAEGQSLKRGEVLGTLVKQKGLYFQVNHGKKIIDPNTIFKS